MEKPHELPPRGAPGDWARHARVGMRKMPEGWSCATMWGQIYPAARGNPATNTLVQIRNPRLWYLSHKDGRWHLLQQAVDVDGAAFRLDFANNSNVKADLRREPDGSVAVRLTPGHNFHFWPPPNGPARAKPDPRDMVAMASSFEARLIVADPSKPDDRNQAHLLGSCGGDFWRAKGVPWKSDWSNNGDWAIGRFKLVTRHWRFFTTTSANPQLLRTNPPPLKLTAPDN